MRLEVASTARALGCSVTLVESGRVPLVRALGQTMGVHCAALHESRGVHVLTRGRVVGFTSDGRVTGVVLDDDLLPVDVVVVGVGAVPTRSGSTDLGFCWTTKRLRRSARPSKRQGR